MDIRTYISDSLLRLTGASDATVIDFILATTGSAKSADSLRDKLVPFLDSHEADIKSFCGELWEKVGGGGRGAREKTKQKRENMAKQRYQLVGMEDDDVPDTDVRKVIGPVRRKEKESGRSKENGERRDSRADADDHTRRKIPGGRDEKRKRDRESHEGDNPDRHRSKKLRKK